MAALLGFFVVVKLGPLVGPGAVWVAPAQKSKMKCGCCGCAIFPPSANLLHLVQISQKLRFRG